LEEGEPSCKQRRRNDPGQEGGSVLDRKESECQEERPQREIEKHLTKGMGPATAKR